MLERRAAAGHRVPALEERPDILGLEWIWNAMMTLDTCRAIGMVAGPVPWTAAWQYAQAEGMTQDEFDLLWEVIIRLEAEEADRQKAKARKNRGGSKRAKNRRDRSR